MRSARLAVTLDVGCVLVFVIIGRASHTKGESLAGVASTAWPFLAGLAGGWLATAALAGQRAWQQPFRLWPAGVGAWLGAVVLGMAFRVVSGQGTAPAFVGVTLAFLGLFLLGWRLLSRLSWLRQ
jgi:FtsH-binding integral membrane protein